MSLPASTLRILLKHGVDADAIVEAAEAAEAEAAAEREARLEKRRESNRKRQRAWYDRHIRNNEDNAVISDDNQDNAVMQREDVRFDDAKKVLEPKKNPSGITTSSTPSGSQVSSPSKPRRFDWPEDFRDRFWDRYPRKTDRKKAMVALDRVWKADKVAFDVVMAGLDRMIISGLEVEFAPHPTTFLNNERWADEWPSRHGRGPNGQGPPPGQRMTGLAQLGQLKHFSRRSEMHDGPTLDLEPQPAPDRLGRFAPDVPDKPGDDRDHEQGLGRDGAGQVYDLPRSRAVG